MMSFGHTMVEWKMHGILGGQRPRFKSHLQNESGDNNLTASQGGCMRIKGDNVHGTTW